MSNIRNPSAAVIVWSYKNRLTNEASNISEVHEVEQTILNTVSLINITTNKSKSSPVGTFTFTLGPYKNWVEAITPGSWCAILMTNEGLTEINKDTKKAEQSELKFFGRINSVRGSVHVSEDGARQTMFVCEGEDWGSVFNSVLYVDPSTRDPKAGAVGTGVALVYGDLIKDITEGSVSIPDTTTNIKALLKLWGTQSSYLSNIADTFASIASGDTPAPVVYSSAVFKMPKEAAKFLGTSPSIASAILNDGGLTTGVLSGYDKYKDTSESVGIIDPSSVIGTHAIWDLIRDNTNNIINEVFCGPNTCPSNPAAGLVRNGRTRLYNPSFGLPSIHRRSQNTSLIILLVLSLIKSQIA